MNQRRNTNADVSANAKQANAKQANANKKRKKKKIKYEPFPVLAEEDNHVLFIGEL